MFYGPWENQPTYITVYIQPSLYTLFLSVLISKHDIRYFQNNKLHAIRPIQTTVRKILTTIFINFLITNGKITI